MNILIVFYSEIQCLCMNDIHLLIIKKKGECNKNKIKEISIYNI